MDVEINPQLDDQFENILQHLIGNESVYFKNQQRNEIDLNLEEKRKIATNVFESSKLLFLTRYGKFLKQKHLDFFRRFANAEDGAEIALIVKNLTRFHSSAGNLLTKNRRYEALKRLIAENSYFSDVEMMKRNPLLYEQLIGQYLSEDEQRQRDRNEENNTLVKILMEGIERDQANNKMKVQEEEEDNAMEEEESDEDEIKPRPQIKPSTSRWGEFSDMQDQTIRKDALHLKKKTFITAQERQLLREEFTTIMYQNFLDGRDDFDYTAVDNDDTYDNIDILEHDEEDKYFDSEEPDEMKGTGKNEESSEDELDIYMNALNQHPTVCNLSKDLEKL